MTLQMLKVHPEGVMGVSNTADTLAVVVVKGPEEEKLQIINKNVLNIRYV